MATSLPFHSGADAEVPQFTKLQKMAALLVMLGPEAAGRILQDFGETEIDAIAAEMAKLTVIDHDLQQAALADFGQVAVEASTGFGVETEVVQATLEKALGESKASTVMSRIAPNQLAVPALQPLLKAEPREIFNHLRNEQVKTAALLLSHLPPAKASPILALYPAEQRETIIERIATLGPIPTEVVQKVATMMSRKLQGSPASAVSHTGGIKGAADVLNALDKQSCKELLESFEKRNPNLCEAIRHKMFTFEDMVRLTVADMQKVLRQVDSRDLAIALKKASESLKAALLSGVSKRAAETVKEEMSFLGTLKPREIEAAQTHIVEIVRKLETDGEIELNAGESEAANDLAA